jgi:hypothetical protein
MKSNLLSFICALTLIVIFASCNNDPSIEEQMDKKYTACYIAVSDKDTAWLTLDTSKYEPIGLLEFNYSAQKRRYLGQFKGTKHGDTIKGHFDFRVNKVDKWYRNPVALLKRDGKLVMGVGEFVTIWGMPEFDLKVPIDFEKGRFVFEEGECGGK